jgi:Uma2 family endonuclease
MSVAAPLSPTPPETSPPRMTFEEFLEWLDEDTRAEWVDGEVIEVMPSGIWHQEIVAFLLTLLRLWAETHGGGRVLPAPFLMLLAPKQPGATRRGRGREPDILYVAPENEGRITEYYVDGPADIVVEVVSPESRKIDRNDKYFEYQRAGVREYWLLDPNNNEAEFYRLVEPGRFERVELEDSTRYHSTVFNGFTLDVSLLWQRPLPSVLEIVKAWETTEQSS